jgi:hypothetical protein
MQADFDEVLETYRGCSNRLLRDMRSAFEADKQSHPGSRAFMEQRVAVIERVLQERGRGTSAEKTKGRARRG